ncbi:MAG: hypothetical protein M1839_005932 [Geoglossum umbratile]|nr:MAG: hypothetical protein M1839_005932 [Geoglossum umbratile]
MIESLDGQQGVSFRNWMCWYARSRAELSGQAVRGLGLATRSVEIIASIAADQQVLGNAPNLSRVQHRTFTSRLVDSVTRKIGRGDSSSVSFAEIVGELRSLSHSQRLLEYHLQVGRVGIRVPILGKTSLLPHLRALLGHHHTPSSSSASDQSAGIPATPTPQLNAVFTIHLDNVDASSGEMGKLVEWIHALHPAIGLELTGVYQSRSTFITLSAPWYIWAQLSGLRDVTLVGKSFGPNMLTRLLRQ